MKKHKYLKLSALLLTVPIILPGCGSTSSKEQTFESSENTSNSSNTDNSSDLEETETLSYQGRVYNCRFLENDQLFQLTLDSYDSNNYIYVDLNNTVVDSPTLTSDYLTEDYITDDSRVVGSNIYDLNGNNISSRFITDSEHEEIMTLKTIIDNRSIVVVKETKETPTDSYCALKFYDEKGNLLCQTDSSTQNNYIKSENLFHDLERISYIYWVGDTILQLSDPNKAAVFSINVDTGELLPPNAIFSDGYAIAEIEHTCIIDVHGNIVTDLSDFSRFESVFPIGDNLFFNPKEKCFYTKELQNSIDLSQYDHFFYTREELSDRASKTTSPAPFVFRDGYCMLTVCNSEDTKFYGIIDSNGNEIYPFTEEAFSYGGVIGDGLLRLNESDVYDIQTKQLIHGLSDIQSATFYDGKAFYVNSTNNFCIYDYKTQQLTTL